MHRKYTEVPSSSHKHYCKPAHSLIQLICMLFCSQRNNRNDKERKTNLITKFLTANLRHLKSCIPSKTHFSYSEKFSVEATRPGITFQDCISFYKSYRSAWHIQHHYYSIFLPFFILHCSQHLWEFIENKKRMLGCKTAAWKNFFLIGRGIPLNYSPFEDSLRSNKKICLTETGLQYIGKVLKQRLSNSSVSWIKQEQQIWMWLHSLSSPPNIFVFHFLLFISPSWASLCLLPFLTLGTLCWQCFCPLSAHGRGRICTEADCKLGQLMWQRKKE